jgi:AraC family transcriptional activator of pobA
LINDGIWRFLADIRPIHVRQTRNMFRAERIDCALHDRVFRLGIGGRMRTWRGILLTSGHGVIRLPEGEARLDGPALAWLRWGADRSLRVAAGGTGIQFAVTEDIVGGAIGTGAESPELRRTADAELIATLAPGGTDLDDARRIFSTIAAESASRASGATAMVEAQLRALLVLIWRSAMPSATPPRAGRAERVLQRFRLLLETHFRARWTVARYAAEIGLSADRLHAICSAELGRTPRDLIRDRTLHEARLMLENTTLGTEQVAEHLGFRDPAHFSRYFRDAAGLPPAAYRRSVLARAAGLPRTAEGDFADWP